MSKITLELSELIEKLPIREKIKLATQLDKETWEIRFNNLVKKIRQKAKRSSITEKEVEQACQRVRSRLYHGEN